MVKTLLIAAAAASLWISNAQAGDRADRANALDRNGWQMVTENSSTCLPMYQVFNGIASPDELSRQFPYFAGQPLHVEFQSQIKALFIDDTRQYPTRILILGQDRCLAFLRNSSFN